MMTIGGISETEFASPVPPQKEPIMVSMDNIQSPYMGRQDFTPIEERDDEESKLNITPTTAGYYD
jgi:hypothetical protein